MEVTSQTHTTEMQRQGFSIGRKRCWSGLSRQLAKARGCLFQPCGRLHPDIQPGKAVTLTGEFPLAAITDVNLTTAPEQIHS